MLLVYLQLISTFIFVVLSYLVGIRILSKYYQTKINLYVPIGIAWMLLASFWISDTYNIIPIHILKEGFVFEGNTKQLFDIFFISMALVVWVYGFLSLIDLKPLWIKYSIVLFYLILEFVIVAIFTFYFYTDIIINGTPLYFLSASFSLLTFLSTGLIFVKKTMEYKGKEWNGRFLFIAFLLFTIGILFELVGVLMTPGSDMNPNTVGGLLYFIGSLILIFSSIFYYWGFFLPKFMKKS